jgi:hypothetical protein
MKYSIKDLSFILYNNRSVDGVIKNFIPKLNPLLLNQVESYLDKSKKNFNLDEKMVQVNINEFDIEANDVIVKKEDIESLTSLIINNIGNLSKNEKEFLSNRGINDNIISKWNILGLSSIKNKRDLETIGATCHPTLSKFLEDGIEHGGILIPLFNSNGLLENMAVRKINSHKSLKYSLACPDIPVWGLENINQYEDISLCEGLFDMMALTEMGKKVVCCSSAMWSGIQLLQVIMKKPSRVSIYSDNDLVGLKTSFILKDFFNMYNIEVKIFKTNHGKDPSEHYFEKGMCLEDFIEVTEIELNEENNDNFNFIEYLKNRTY